MLWSCHENRIEIFDKNLKRIRILQKEAWGLVSDVAMHPNAGIVIASENTLLHIDDTGDTIGEIDSGHFSLPRVCIYNGTMYASTTETIRRYTYSDGAWIKQGHIKLPREGLNTMSENNDTITVCYNHSQIIDVLSMSGQQLYTYDLKGTEGAGGLRFPLLCQEDSEGALLVADSFNYRLQLLDNRRRWTIINIGPQQLYPQNAVYVDDTLYVHVGKDFIGYKLCKYIAK